MKATVKVTHFKGTGKLYGDKVTDLKPEHQEMEGYKLAALFRENNESTHEYSGVLSNFATRTDYYVTVEVTYPEDVTNFCFFIMDNTDKQ